jgi:hypothetical protein
MLLDALFHYREGFVGPPLKNVMPPTLLKNVMILGWNFVSSSF